MLRWVIKEQLAGGPRPRVSQKPRSQVSKAIVDAWIKKTKTEFGIRSIICLLDQRQMTLYLGLRMDLVSYHRASGFQAKHIPVRNYKHPALSDYELGGVWKAYQQLEKPVLVHCSAGIGRSGKALSHIERKLRS